MWETDIEVPDDLGLLALGAAEAGAVDDVDEAVAAGLAELFTDDDLRRAAAAGYYRRFDDVSVGSAADLAGVSKREMLTILDDHDVEARYGPPEGEALADEVGCRVRDGASGTPDRNG